MYPPENSHPQQTDYRSVESRPLVTFIILGVTVGVYALQILSQTVFGGADIPANLGMKFNPFIIDGQYWRLFTPMLLHGSVLHLGFNMYALYIFGPTLERYYGRLRFLLLYLLSGFAGNVFSFIFTANPSLGSSTAIFGLLAAEGVFLYLNRDVFGEMAQRALGQIIMIAVINFAIGLSPGIDNWGHLGGLIGGGIFAWTAGPVLQVEGIYPIVNVRDRRESSAVAGGAILVAVMFVGLTIMTIYQRTH